MSPLEVVVAASLVGQTELHLVPIDQLLTVVIQRKFKLETGKETFHHGLI
jgi:hypothetical protein